MVLEKDVSGLWGYIVLLKYMLSGSPIFFQKNKKKGRVPYNLGKYGNLEVKIKPLLSLFWINSRVSEKLLQAQYLYTDQTPKLPAFFHAGQYYATGKTLLYC